MISSQPAKKLQNLHDCCQQAEQKDLSQHDDTKLEYQFTNKMATCPLALIK